MYKLKTVLSHIFAMLWCVLLLHIEQASCPAWSEPVLLQYKNNLAQTLGYVHTIQALPCNLKINRVSTRVHIQLLLAIIVPEISAMK